MLARLFLHCFAQLIYMSIHELRGLLPVMVADGLRNLLVLFHIYSASLPCDKRLHDSLYFFLLIDQHVQNGANKLVVADVGHDRMKLQSGLRGIPVLLHSIAVVFHRTYKYRDILRPGVDGCLPCRLCLQRTPYMTGYIFDKDITEYRSFFCYRASGNFFTILISSAFL